MNKVWFYDSEYIKSFQLGPRPRKNIPKINTVRKIRGVEYILVFINIDFEQDKITRMFMGMYPESKNKLLVTRLITEIWKNKRDWDEKHRLIK